MTRAAVVASDNDATRIIWDGVGAPTLLRRLSSFMAPARPLRLRDGQTGFGGVLVSPAQVVRGYLALQAAAGDDPAAKTIMDCMGRASVDFGVADIARAAGQVPTGWKCGWDCYDDRLLRTHAVVVCEDLTACVMTAASLADGQYRDWAAAAATPGQGERLLAVHEEFAGAAIRDALRGVLPA